MSEICINNLYITCSDKHIMERIVSGIEKEFDSYFLCDGLECAIGGKEYYEIEFVSASVYPEKEIEKLTGNITDPTLYIQAISYERSLEYIAFNRYKEGKWENIIEIKNRG